MTNDYLAVGKVINTHGIKGEIKVMPITSDISRFDYLLYVTTNYEGTLKEFRVLKCRIHKGFVLITLKGIETMDDAEKLKGQELLVHRKHAIELEEDEFFICDIIGLDVYEEDKLLGRLTDVLETGSNDVYIITDENKKEILIPALKSVVLNVDIEGKRMQVKIPEGLIDDI
ncbi:MAG: ribosome maturation factor RimM [Acetivibrionales bacterium]|jgi:16S rRNA processing protein RimM|nr:16S rRNA processing protein RimM [Clostridiaceae bacterium]